MSQERLDTVLRWITFLWVIATLVLITATLVRAPQLLKSRLIKPLCWEFARLPYDFPHAFITRLFSLVEAAGVGTLQPSSTLRNAIFFSGLQGAPSAVKPIICPFFSHDYRISLDVGVGRFGASGVQMLSLTQEPLLPCAAAQLWGKKGHVLLSVASRAKSA